MDKQAVCLFQADYYDAFHCLAGECVFSCCRDWRIGCTRPEYGKIQKAVKGTELEELTQDALKRNRTVDERLYAQFQVDGNGRCLYMNEGGLCRLQMVCGAQTLTRVCKEFPRFSIIIGDSFVRSCLPACEEVVRLLWERKNGLSFQKDQRMVDRRKEALEPRQKRAADIHLLCTAILQNQGYSLDERVLLLGIAVQGLSQAEGWEDGIDKWIVKYASMASGSEWKENLRQFFCDSTLSLGYALFTIRELLPATTEGLLRNSLRSVLANWGYLEKKEQFHISPRRLGEARPLLEKALSGSPRLLENLLVNELFGGLIFSRPNISAWDGYMCLCVQYSLLKVILLGLVTPETTGKQLIQMIVTWAREFLHNKGIQNLILGKFHDTKSDTLAHMAVLVNV